MRKWLTRLFDRNDLGVDLLMLLIAVYAVLAFTGIILFLYLSWFAVHTLHQEWTASGFGSGIGLTFTGVGLMAFLHTWKWPGSGDPK